MVSVDVEHHVYLHTNFGGHLLYQATKQQLEYLNGEKWDVFVFSFFQALDPWTGQKQTSGLPLHLIFHHLAVILSITL